ncbi:MAG: type II toxin-antitoxin system VapC family toxin [Cyclobacteriaceae bacterium]
MAEKGIVILDTNILIEIIRKNREVIQKCDSAGTENLAISSIRRSEFLLGSRDKEDFEKNKKFVSKFSLLKVTEPIDNIFTELYELFSLSHRPGIPYLLIAATALNYTIPLYTLSAKDFRFIPNLILF